VRGGRGRRRRVGSKISVEEKEKNKRRKRGERKKDKIKKRGNGERHPLNPRSGPNIKKPAIAEHASNHRSDWNKSGLTVVPADRKIGGSGMGTGRWVRETGSGLDWKEGQTSIKEGGQGSDIRTSGRGRGRRGDRRVRGQKGWREGRKEMNDRGGAKEKKGGS